MTFAEPEDTGGARIYPKNVLGHLLMVWAIDYIPHSPTQFTQPGKPSDVIIVDVVDLDGIDENTGAPGFLARKTWWRQSQLIQSLKPRIGGQDPVLAHMSKGGATMGRNAPFVLVSATGDPQCVARATAWLKNNGGYKPSTPSLQLPSEDEFRASEAAVNQGAQPAWSTPLPPASPQVQQEYQESLLERMARQASQPKPSQTPLPTGAQYQYPDEPPY